MGDNIRRESGDERTKVDLLPFEKLDTRAEKEYVIKANADR